MPKRTDAPSPNEDQENDDLAEQELDLAEAEAEEAAAQAAASEADEEVTDEVEDEDIDDGPDLSTQAPQQRTTQPGRSGNYVPEDRFKAVNDRVAQLEQLLRLATSQPNQPQPHPQAQPQPQRDPYEGFTPQAKQWAQFIERVANPQVERLVQERLSAVLPNVQKEQMLLRDMLDEINTRRAYPDFDQYADEVNVLREQWYRAQGVVAPRDVAYHYVKGRKAGQQRQTERTQQVRRAAKPGATAPSPKPARKVAPAGAPLSLDRVNGMSEKDLEQLMLKMNLTF